MCGIVFRRSSESYAGLAQLVEQLICNQQVGGSSPSTSSTLLNQVFSDLKPKRVAPLRKHHGVMFLGARCAATVLQAWQTFARKDASVNQLHPFMKGAQLNMGVFPSGQRGQTVNLLALPSVVRIHPLPPKILVR